MKFDYRETPAGKRRFANPEVYQKTFEFQNYLESQGIAFHNPYSDECNSDFCCCEGNGNYQTYFPSYAKFAKQLLEELYEEIKHGDEAHQQWLKKKMNEFLKKNENDFQL